MYYQEDISSHKTECQEPTNYQALLFENQALKDEIESLRSRLEETEELRRAISEGDLDALVIPGSKGDLVFTLDSADRAYRLLVETMNEGTATLAFDGTILYCNRRLAELLNIHSQNIVGTSIHQFIAPESEIAFKAFLKHKINAGEINLRTKDGRSLPVYLSISSTQGGASPNAWCIVVTDLTEQKKNEEIVAAERLARSIIEQAAEMIANCDTSGRIIRFSNSMSKLCKCNPMFQQFEDIINLQFAGGEAKGESILPVSSALRGSNILGMEAIFKSENHQKLNLLINTGPLLNDDGKIIGCTVALTDITERKQKEHRILRYNRILEGINRIFSNVVQAKTEEELGEACLSVALEVTGSEFGFINEMGDYGLLHDVAKSELGWEQCLMYDKTGHRRPPSEYIVHGLYGSVIINEKGFFTNNPQSHPDSIGLPEGHPPLTSFLGVPLVQDGKTIGVIAVANHEGDYSFEQQEDLEAIAPAVSQVLQRRKVEQERKQFEEQIRLRAEEMETVMEVAPVAIWFGHDPQCNNITGNRMANEFYEVDDGENVSANVTTERRFFHKGRELTADELPMQKAASKNIDVRNEEVNVLLPGGKYRTFLGSASPLYDPEGNVRGSVGAFMDITERKKAEEKILTLANVVESSNDAIITVSLDGIVTSWNKGAEQVYGYLAEEVLGKNISILEPDVLKGEAKQLFDEIKKGKKVKNYETSWLKKDGTTINISVNLSPIMDQSGNLVAISFIVGDITEKKIAEKLLHEKEMAEVANSTKSKFLANMSHELRTPLNSIIGFSDMLHEQAYGDLNQKQLRAAGNISKSGRHLLNLINNILDISKIEAGKMELNYKNFELSSKLSLIRNLLSPIADRKNTTIEIDIDSKLTSICADEDKFIQIMHNLIDNAIKFSYEDSFVKIEARKKGELVEISVKDTGIGIKTEDQNKLFKSFSQIDHFSSRKHQGTGLGLHLVKQIVQLHGGYVWFRSNLGEGSTFAFAIPINSKNLPKKELDENFFT
jgi:PAS domain S-box-containing protein